MKLNRAATNFLLDALALIVLVGVLWTRIVAFWIVPLPADGVAPVRLWGLNHRGWDLVNFWATMGFAVVVLVHLILHWTWISQFVHQRIKRMTRSKGVLDSGTQTVYGVGFMIAVFVVAGGLLAVAAVAAKPVP
ncbi:MAG TPA: DUF4405 domain-containing protein [Phycisphaerae bacterium]|nr:hypothetical protein [Phycisphaerales bacterium]HRX85430.1 DUF4405 domain-containing protein [Phycisphaerae bacterium]